MPLAPRPDGPPLLVVAHDDPGTADALRHAVERAGWRVAVAEPGAAGLAAALATRPAVALVGCATLGELPPGCGVPVLGVGDDTRPADLDAVAAAGAVGLVTWPDGAADLSVLPLHGSSAILNDLDSRPLPAGGPRLAQHTAGAGFPFRHHLPAEAGLLVGSTGALGLRATPGDQAVG
jgi:hypothetical protein